MRKKIFIIFIVTLSLIYFQNFALAENKIWKRIGPIHLIVLMPSMIAGSHGDDPKNYEGVSFPLYCGIISLYPKENKFIFTKTTNLPILGVKRILHPIERDGYLTAYPHHHPPVRMPVENYDFYFFFLDWIGINGGLAVYEVSRGQEVPINVVPRFTKTCSYNAAKDPPTDCADDYQDINKLYIPFTEEEMEQIAKDHAK